MKPQLDTEFTSNNGLKDALFKIKNTALSEQDKYQNTLVSACLDTPLGPMLAISDEEKLYLLEFMNRRALETEIRRLQAKTQSAIISGLTDPINSIQAELKAYFEGKLHHFRTPFRLFGTPFQRRVWEKLKEIPYGKTCSYGDLAKSLGQPSAFRAVANANGSNQLALIIPCHRVINTSGELGGYAGGIQRKEWLINHEKKFMR